MAEEIGFENGRNSNFQGLVTLTLTLDPAIRHTVVHHSSRHRPLPVYQISLKSKKLFVDGRTYGRTYGRTDIFPPLILLGRLPKVDLKKKVILHCTTLTFWRCIAEYYHLLLLFLQF